jgi:hypothetical protein
MKPKSRFRQRQTSLTIYPIIVRLPRQRCQHVAPYLERELSAGNQLDRNFKLMPCGGADIF